jgi:hypothetical protein
MATTQEYESYQYEGSFSLFGQQTGNLLKNRFVDLTKLMVAHQQVAACTLDRNCIEPPPTTELAVAPAATTPDVGAGTVEAQPADVERFTGTSFSWVGGGPSAEWQQNDALVELQRQNGTSWQTVTSDLDSTLPVHYDKCGSEHHWMAYTDPTVDAPAGTYRFHVTGHSAIAAGVVQPYVLDSAPFDVKPFRYLTVRSQLDGNGNPTGVFYAANPTPQPLANFRYRPQADPTAAVEGARGTFTLAPGETRTIAPGAITDGYGNTNAQTITVTGTTVQATPARPAADPVAPKLVCASAPNASVPETPWTPGFALLAMVMAGLVVRRARHTRP